MTEPFLIRPDIVDGERRRAAVECLRAAQVTLPSWSELADPAARHGRAQALDRGDPRR